MDNAKDYKKSKLNQEKTEIQLGHFPYVGGWERETETETERESQQMTNCYSLFNGFKCIVTLSSVNCGLEFLHSSLFSVSLIYYSLWKHEQF